MRARTFEVKATYPDMAKHFLRLHVDRAGQLTIWPIKIHRVPRRWRDRGAADATMSRVVPDEPMPVALIEPPIRVR